jgi:hypothetical protein
MMVSATKIKEVKEFLRDYFDLMDVPDDEDGLIKFIIDKFAENKTHYENLNSRYESHKYPDRTLVQSAVALMTDILSQQKDNIALIDRVIKKQDELYDNKEAMMNVESFFKTQVSVFDAAVRFEADLHNDLDYIAKDEEAHKALNTIRLITMVQSGKYDYKRIPELNGLMATVKASHDKMLEDKRAYTLEIVRQCMEAIHTAANGDNKVKNIIDISDTYYTQRKEKINETTSLALLDGFEPTMWQYKDDTVERIETVLKPEVYTPPTPTPSVVKEGVTTQPTPKKEIIKAIPRQAMFPAKILKTEDEVDAYLEKIRAQMTQMLKNCDGIKIN